MNYSGYDGVYLGDDLTFEGLHIERGRASCKSHSKERRRLKLAYIAFRVAAFIARPRLRDL